MTELRKLAMARKLATARYYLETDPEFRAAMIAS
jgi:hypothetical protein